MHSQGSERRYRAKSVDRCLPDDDGRRGAAVAVGLAVDCSECDPQRGGWAGATLAGRQGELGGASGRKGRLAGRRPIGDQPEEL